MEITLSEKSLRAAYLFTRMEMIKAKHGGNSCVMCCAGGRSIAYAFSEKIEALHLLEAEREVLKKFGRVDEKHYDERRSSLYEKEFPIEKLNGFWRDFFEMIEEEGLDTKDFINFCQLYFYRNPRALDGGCQFASSGWEGWLYRQLRFEPKKK